MRYQIKPLPRDLSFDKGFYVCLRALQLLTQHNKGCIIVGVAGERNGATLCFYPSDSSAAASACGTVSTMGKHACACVAFI